MPEFAQTIELSRVSPELSAAAHLGDLADRRHRRPDVLLGVERADAKTHRAADLGRAQLLVHQRGAVQPGPCDDIVCPGKDESVGGSQGKLNHTGSLYINVQLKHHQRCCDFV